MKEKRGGNANKMGESSALGYRGTRTDSGAICMTKDDMQGKKNEDGKGKEDKNSPKKGDTTRNE